MIELSNEAINAIAVKTAFFVILFIIIFFIILIIIGWSFLTVSIVPYPQDKYESND